MIVYLVMILKLLALAYSAPCDSKAGQYDANEVRMALGHLEGMRTDLQRFPMEWNLLSAKVAAQGTRWAIESCVKNHKPDCTSEKRSQLANCVANESHDIRDRVSEIYDERVREPWTAEFDRLKIILQNPDCGEVVTVNETVETVHPNAHSKDSVRHRFYNALVNFQLPIVAPDVYPIEKVYTLCLERHFPN